MAKTTVSETKGIKRLDVQGAGDVDEIWVDGELVWAKWDREEYKYIPPTMRQFIKDHHNYLELDGTEQVIADVVYRDEEFTLYFATSGRKSITARFDLIFDPHDIPFLEEVDEETAKPFVDAVRAEWNRMISVITATGFPFKLSHGGNDLYDAWWDVVIPTREWNEGKFSLCVDAIHAFTKRLVELEKEHGIK